MCELDITNNRKELVGELKTRRREMDDWLKRWLGRNKTADLNEIIRDAIGNDTWRAISGNPSKIFHKWACNELNDRIVKKEIKCLKSIESYDIWLEKFSQNLAQYWRGNSGRHNELLYCHKRKLIDLLLKRLTFMWTDIEECIRNGLIYWLHVPLDRYVIERIKDCIYRSEYAESIGNIRESDVHMGFVRNKEMYDALQNVIRNIAEKAKVPPIYIDILAWDLKHSNS